MDEFGDGRSGGMDDLSGNGDEYMIVRILYWDFRDLIFLQFQFEIFDARSFPRALNIFSC